MNGAMTEPAAANRAATGAGTRREREPVRYRTGSEFLRPLNGKGKDGDGGGPPRWLRVFEDGNGVLVAGLYDAPDPDVNDHWANGDPATDEADAAMAAKCIPYGDTDSMKTALLGIAYRRVYDRRTEPIRVEVPADLKPWAVRTPGKDGPDDIEYVMSSSDIAAKATAAVFAFDRTRAKATARCLR